MDRLASGLLIGAAVTALLVGWWVLSAMWIELKPAVHAHPTASLVSATALALGTIGGAWQLIRYLRKPRPGAFVSIAPQDRHRTRKDG